MKLLPFLIFVSFLSHGYAQTNFENEMHILNIESIANDQRNKIAVKAYGDNEIIQSEYIGFLTDLDGNRFFVVNSSIIVNQQLSPTCTSFIMIYGENKKFIGYYYLSLRDQLPEVIQNNQMIFKRLCKNQIAISFEKGIPKAINLGCESMPDFYEFIKRE